MVMASICALSSIGRAPRRDATTRRAPIACRVESGSILRQTEDLFKDGVLLQFLLNILIEFETRQLEDLQGLLHLLRQHQTLGLRLRQAMFHMHHTTGKLLLGAVWESAFFNQRAEAKTACATLRKGCMLFASRALTCSRVGNCEASTVPL